MRYNDIPGIEFCDVCERAPEGTQGAFDESDTEMTKPCGPLDTYRAHGGNVYRLCKDCVHDAPEMLTKV